MMSASSSREGGSTFKMIGHPNTLFRSFVNSAPAFVYSISVKPAFTKAQLIPQEETLEITKEKGELFIGIPKETYFQEKRICLTPDAVAAIVANDHRVLIENGAGEKAGFISDICKLLEALSYVNKCQL